MNDKEEAMKKLMALLFAVVFLAGLSAQQKYALVMGNGAYTSLTRLNNPVNDANDVSAVLRNLGFQVDLVLNGTLDQMEEGAIRLKNRLSANANAYGFFFYAGHGVQSKGENYLIPVNADIKSESFLRSKALQVQAVLDELNQAGNALNIVVLDACRDNPFSWGRSGERGLNVVAVQPVDSIIVYATSAGKTAGDGTGRNGLFTSHLLTNLKTPGLEVTEMLRRTGADVSRFSNREQIPAIYNQFFGTAYLGTKPTAQVVPQPAPQPASVQPNPKAVEYYNSGNEYRKKGDYDRAIGDYNQAIRINPNYADAYHNRGVAYEKKGDWDRAMADYDQVITLNPTYAYAYYGRGNAYRKKGDWDRAIGDYNQVITLDPNYAYAYNSRGVAYRNKGDYDRAIGDYNQAIRLDPNYAYAYYNRGLAYYDKKDWDRAIGDYNQAIRLDPNYADTYYGRGLAYYNKKDYDRAIGDYSQAIRINPNYADAYVNRGWAYSNKGDYDRAIEDYNQAITLNPNHALAYNNRGWAYEEKGNYPRARADYEKALQLDPNNNYARNNLERLRKAGH
jgi:tetratricopeptide (TPR) repeat protein